jgi:hypothetical protein
MNPKEEAIELIESHTLYEGDNGALKEYYTDNLEAKRHALISINEKIKYHESLFDKGFKDVHIVLTSPIKTYNEILNPLLKHLIEVRKEIEKL